MDEIRAVTQSQPPALPQQGRERPERVRDEREAPRRRPRPPTTPQKAHKVNLEA
jgi:hypothetical protein